MKRFVLQLLLPLVCWTLSMLAPVMLHAEDVDPPRLRAGEAGVVIGTLPAGKLNAISVRFV